MKKLAISWVAGMGLAVLAIHLLDIHSVSSTFKHGYGVGYIVGALITLIQCLILGML